MKVYKLKRKFQGYKRGTQFYLVAESEYIGVKEFVLKPEDLTDRLSINEHELEENFIFIRKFY